MTNTAAPFTALLRREIDACLAAHRALGGAGAADTDLTERDCLSIAEALEDEGLMSPIKNRRTLSSIRAAVAFTDGRPAVGA